MSPTVTHPEIRIVIRIRRGINHSWRTVARGSHSHCRRRSVISWRGIDGCGRRVINRRRRAGHTDANGCSHCQPAQNTARDSPTTCPGLRGAESRHRQGQGGDTGCFHKRLHIKPLLMLLNPSLHLDISASFFIQLAGSYPLGVLCFEAGSCRVFNTGRLFVSCNGFRLFSAKGKPAASWLGSMVCGAFMLFSAANGPSLSCDGVRTQRNKLH